MADFLFYALACVLAELGLMLIAWPLAKVLDLVGRALDRLEAALRAWEAGR
ncbi:MAG: hypothetical protein AAF533_22180 [Acidobacteriota bacterium]